MRAPGLTVVRRKTHRTYGAGLANLQKATAARDTQKPQNAHELQGKMENYTGCCGIYKYQSQKILGWQLHNIGHTTAHITPATNLMVPCQRSTSGLLSELVKSLPQQKQM